MKTFQWVVFVLLWQQVAQAADIRFFRVAGPVPNRITALTGNGYLTWTNVPTNATFTVQAAACLDGATNWVDYIRVPVTNGTTSGRLFDHQAPAGMVLIPAGSFEMGNGKASEEGWQDELPVHEVYVSAVYMDATEVSKAVWDDVYNWAVLHNYSFDYGALGKAGNHPAEKMAWYDAVKWCNARSEKEGRKPAYYSDTNLSVVYRSGMLVPSVNWTNGYRLPTEAEWEKAARGGASGWRFPWGDFITHDLANYKSSSSYAYDISPTQGYHPDFQADGVPYTNPVDYFASNGYGLRGMTGNVWEWCWDFYGGYSSAAQTDPHGPVSGSYHVYRGGSWDLDTMTCRTSCRDYGNPLARSNGGGFRSVLPTR
jgi:formylglycine-generating enzyme required for sulfatase activity